MPSPAPHHDGLSDRHARPHSVAVGHLNHDSVASSCHRNDLLRLHLHCRRLLRRLVCRLVSICRHHIHLGLSHHLALRLLGRCNRGLLVHCSLLSHRLICCKGMHCELEVQGGLLDLGLAHSCRHARHGQFLACRQGFRRHRRRRSVGRHSLGQCSQRHCCQAGRRCKDTGRCAPAACNHLSAGGRRLALLPAASHQQAACHQVGRRLWLGPGRDVNWLQPSCQWRIDCPPLGLAKLGCLPGALLSRHRLATDCCLLLRWHVHSSRRGVAAGGGSPLLQRLLGLVGGRGLLERLCCPQRQPLHDMRRRQKRAQRHRRRLHRANLELDLQLGVL